jgi:enoyl-CoA hydratase
LSKKVSNELVVFSRKDNGVVWLTLNDPPTRNAMGEEMAEQWKEAIDRIRQDSDSRVLVISGAGSAFSAGGNLEMLFNKTKIEPETNRELMELFYHQFLSIRDLQIPTIAAINGHAVGAGLCVALACDLRCVRAGAKLGLNFVNIGLHPGMGATYFLPRLVGPARAAELLFAGKIISSEEALAIGLVNHHFEETAFDTGVTALADAIASSGPLAVRQLKASLCASSERTLEECLKREAECQAENYAGSEFLEGISAAREKRSPVF